MSIEVRSQEVKEFLYDGQEEGVLYLHDRLDDIDPQTPSNIHPQVVGNRHLAFTSTQSLYTGSLLMYGIESAQGLYLGFTTLPQTPNRTDSKFEILLQDEASQRASHRLYAPLKPLPPSFYSYLNHPEIKNALISSVNLTFDSSPESRRFDLKRAWERCLTTLKSHPNKPTEAITDIEKVLNRR